MKRTFGYVVTILALLALLYSGCATDDPAPAPTDPRQVYLGVWSVNENEIRLTYEVNIELDPASQNKGVYIYNFANAGYSSIPAHAVVSGNTITLDVNQVIGDDWIINGSGTLSGSKINFPYTLNVGSDLHHILAVFTRP